MKERLRVMGLVAAGLSGLLAACSASGESPGKGGAGSGGAAGGGTSASGSGGESFSGVGSGGATSGGGGGEQCAGEKSTAELVPLDLYIMLDSSGSMLDATLLGTTKWDAVTGALVSFFNDPEVAGLGAGLQYFPQRVPGVPDVCSSDAECNGHGPCLFRICQNESRFQRITRPCNVDSDCGFLDTCVEIGECSVSGTGCVPAGVACGSGDGLCTAVTESFCHGQDYCEASAYATPDVPISLLPGAAPQLIASMETRVPVGATPTAAALAGAIQQAREHATANPDRKVVAVLATDGLPTECTPVAADGIAQIAAGGLNGSPSVPTFVIGIFAGLDLNAQTTLNQIAAGGGTGQAIFADTNQNVGQAFLDALNTIRTASLACEYQVPTPTDGQTVDFGRVNVEYTPEGASTSTTIFYVTNAQGCSGTTGGWYYDIDPAGGGRPTKLIMCPSTCTTFKTGGAVDISVGCETERPR
jgi:hypothetical protein